MWNKQTRFSGRFHHACLIALVTFGQGYEEENMLTTNPHRHSGSHLRHRSGFTCHDRRDRHLGHLRRRAKQASDKLDVFFAGVAVTWLITAGLMSSSVPHLGWW